MRAVNLVTLIVLVSFTTGAPLDCSEPEDKPQYNLNDAPALFQQFIRHFNKKYKDDADEQDHYAAFITYLKKINKANSDPNQLAKFDINQFSDYTNEEKTKMRGHLVPKRPKTTKPLYNLHDALALFEQFIQDFNKIYKNEADKQMHYMAFVESLKAMNKLNSDPNQSATFSINKFTDYTNEEHKKMLGLIVRNNLKTKPQYNLANARALYEKFIKDFNKTFKNELDKQVHFEAFYKSLEQVNMLNADPNQTATYAINQFADYTHEERQKMHGLIVPKKYGTKPIYDIHNAPKLFQQFIKNFNKVYKNEGDKEVHYKAFVKYLKAINKLNSDPAQTGTFSINKFADYTDEMHNKIHELRVSDKRKVKPLYNLDNAPALFEHYIKDFNKTFENDADKQVHYEAFVESLKQVNRMNSDPNQTATFAINQFADYTHEQRQKMHRLIYNLDDASKLFEQFIKNFNKTYKNEADKLIHYQAFIEYLKNINKSNSDPTQTDTFGIYQFADYIDEEQKQTYGLQKAKRRENKLQYNLDDAPALFELYIKDFNKTYRDETDKQIHYKAFVKSLKKANRLNSDPNVSTTFVINQFADLTDEERRIMSRFIVIEKPEIKPLYNLDDAQMLFEQYIKDFNKTFKDEGDKQFHYNAFYKSLELVNRLNSDPTQTVAFVINQFADSMGEDCL